MEHNSGTVTYIERIDESLPEHEANDTKGHEAKLAVRADRCAAHIILERCHNGARDATATKQSWCEERCK